MHILNNEPLSRHTTYCIGGPVDCMLFPETHADFLAVPEMIGDQPYMLLGNGSNVLFADQPFHAVIINLTRWTGITTKNSNLTVASGTSLAELTAWAGEHALSGYDFLAGIPGSVGGAVFMNAGAWGKYMDALVQAVEVFQLDTRSFKWYAQQELSFAYRRQTFLQPQDIITQVRLKATDTAQDAAENIKEIKRKRAEKHPCGLSCGSVFKNPPDQPAGKLIEACGLKGTKHGGAQISDKHTNFILNTGSASFTDIMALITLAQKKVKEKFDILLEPEVKIIQDIDSPLFRRL
ncbi:MAG TPA: UDP-N-acetylmuramate dehydrogenase [bacterium]|nr:UDP-N-acetylmuramate dehydrogenase [bacterium]